MDSRATSRKLPVPKARLKKNDGKQHTSQNDGRVARVFGIRNARARASSAEIAQTSHTAEHEVLLKEK